MEVKVYSTQKTPVPRNTVWEEGWEEKGEARGWAYEFIRINRTD